MLADWNGLMIAALVHAAQIFDRPDWLAAARTAFSFVVSAMEKDGRLIHSYRAGQAKAPATASDYANMIWGALRLHQATNAPDYLAAAERWAAVLDARYWETEAGGYAFTADDTPDVIVRMRSAHDDATPNANAIMISNLVALNLLTGKQSYLDRAHAIPAASRRPRKNPLGHCGLLAGFFDLLAPQQVVVISADADNTTLAAPCSACRSPAQSSRYCPTPPARQPRSRRQDRHRRRTHYACIGPQCSLPVTEPDMLLELLRTQRAAPLS